MQCYVAPSLMPKPSNECLLPLTLIHFLRRFHKEEHRPMRMRHFHAIRAIVDSLLLNVLDVVLCYEAGRGLTN